MRECLARHNLEKKPFLRKNGAQISAQITSVASAARANGVITARDLNNRYTAIIAPINNMRSFFNSLFAAFGTDVTVGKAIAFCAIHSPSSRNSNSWMSTSKALFYQREGGNTET